mmetsp:Transcript_78358/g.217652  ORF Transcript_78358/g.217652 Transcript_78358/m.217652 type:complete len:227 (+) Transcript_78358:2644-3324(+)
MLNCFSSSTVCDCSCWTNACVALLAATLSCWSSAIRARPRASGRWPPSSSSSRSSSTGSLSSLWPRPCQSSEASSSRDPSCPDSESDSMDWDSPSNTAAADQPRAPCRPASSEARRGLLAGKLGNAAGALSPHMGVAAIGCRSLRKSCAWRASNWLWPLLVGKLRDDSSASLGDSPSMVLTTSLSMAETMPSMRVSRLRGIVTSCPAAMTPWSCPAPGRATPPYGR